MEEIEQVQSDESNESSSETPSEKPDQSSSENNSQAETKTKQEESQVPFHEHPRFKELIEQKNQALEKANSLEERYKSLEARLSQLTPQEKVKQEAEIIKRLKGIDPEFGSWAEQQEAARQELVMMKEHLQYQNQENTRRQALDSIEKLHTENKVPDSLKPLYQAQIEMLSTRNPNLKISDLPQVYKTIHDQMSKIMDEVKRTERESYLTGKKVDAKVPTSQPKGKNVQAGKSPEFSKDPAEAKMQLIKRVLAEAKANNQL